jgi:hypothetical protein
MTGTIAVKDLKGNGQPFPRCHKADADLRAVGTAVAAIAPRCLGIAFGAAFKVGGGDVVEEKVEGGAEQLTVPVLKMPAQVILTGEQGIQGTVEPVIIDLIARDTEQIIKCRLVVP